MTNASGVSARGLHHDVYVGLVLLVFCAVTFYITTTFDSVPAMLSQNIPATFFPRIILFVIAGLSVILIVSGLRRSPEKLGGIPGSVFLTAGVITLAIFLVKPLGTLLTVSLLSMTLTWLWGERSKTRIISLAIGLPAAIYLIFAIGLQVRFPAGVVVALLGAGG